VKVQEPEKDPMGARMAKNRLPSLGTGSKPCPFLHTSLDRKSRGEKMKKRPLAFTAITALLGVGA
jgi:hypothetical protein